MCEIERTLVIVWKWSAPYDKLENKDVAPYNGSVCARLVGIPENAIVELISGKWAVKKKQLKTYLRDINAKEVLVMVHNQAGQKLDPPIGNESEDGRLLAETIVEEIRKLKQSNIGGVKKFGGGKEAIYRILDDVGAIDKDAKDNEMIKGPLFDDVWSIYWNYDLGLKCRQIQRVLLALSYDVVGIQKSREPAALGYWNEAKRSYGPGFIRQIRGLLLDDTDSLDKTLISMHPKQRDNILTNGELLYTIGLKYEDGCLLANLKSKLFADILCFLQPSSADIGEHDMNSLASMKITLDAAIQGIDGIYKIAKGQSS